MNFIKKKPKILVIIGPTSSGKSQWAVQISKKFRGEVVSVDSRQIYKGLNLTSGKISEKEMEEIPHHMLSLADPKESFSVVRYKTFAEKAINSIISRGNLPVITGGTGFYTEAIVKNASSPEVPPNTTLRKELHALATKELFDRLATLDPNRAETIDPSNRIRLIRSLEIVESLGKVPQRTLQLKYHALQIGIRVEPNELKERITKRTTERLQSGMIEEAERLFQSGLSLHRMKELGLDLRILAEYIEGSISKSEIQECIIQENRKYARRQMIWFRRDKTVEWFRRDEKEKAFQRINDFLKNEE